jgi:hypothetical protein
MTNTTTIASEATTGRNGVGVVLYGLDGDGKPCAARFSSQQAAQATEAAKLMNLAVCPVTANLAEVAARLPLGRLYANGRGFVPNVRRDLYAKLIELAGTSALNSPNAALDQAAAGQANATAPSTDAAAVESPAPLLAQGYPRDWGDISVGHLVIATDHPGWYEAIVTAIEGDQLTLRFRDYPRQATVVRHRSAVALLKPDAA